MSSPTSDLVEDDDFDNSSVDSGPQSKKMKLASSSTLRICVSMHAHILTPVNTLQVLNKLEKCQ